MPKVHKIAAYRANSEGRLVHQALAEKALGKPLPKGAEVHHIDENKLNNDPSNLVICPSKAYHLLLHARQRVLNAGGNPNTDKICYDCKQLKLLDAFNLDRKSGRQGACRACSAKRMKVWHQKRKLSRLSMSPQMSDS